MQEVLSDTKKACSLSFFLCPELNILTYVPQTFLSAHSLSCSVYIYGKEVLLAFFCILPYLGTLVGGRRGIENGPAGGGIRIFPAGGGSTFSSGGGGTVKLQKEP